MGVPNVSKIGDFLTPRGAAGDLTVTSGAGHDNAAQTGASCDRLDYESATIVIAGIASISATFLLTWLLKIQDSADNSSWNAATTLQAVTTLQAGATTSIPFVGRFDLNLAAYNRYVRLVLTLQANKGSVDTYAWGASFVLGGAVNKQALAS
jgi:hypothetical protein